MQAARDQSAAAAAFEAADDLAAAFEAWRIAQQKWYCAAFTRNGKTEEGEPDYSGPEGEECKKGFKQLSDDEIDTKLDAGARLFCCLHGRDQFIASFTKLLA